MKNINNAVNLRRFVLTKSDFVLLLLWTIITAFDLGDHQGKLREEISRTRRCDRNIAKLS